MNKIRKILCAGMAVLLLSLAAVFPASAEASAEASPEQSIASASSSEDSAASSSVREPMVKPHEAAESKREEQQLEREAEQNDPSHPIIKFVKRQWKNFSTAFYVNFIEDNRWTWMMNGLSVTLIITLFAVIVGILIGFILAIIRTVYDTTGKGRILNAVAKLYLTVIRGTPATVQLLIIYYIVFAPFKDMNKILVAIIAFGINSGAYVAEIFRSGIMSIDKGQLEAGRSLGLNYAQTMIHIIMPQAFKNVLPTLGNELIVLLKETSICGYIALEDLTRSATTIRSVTYSAFMPLIAVALIYLAIVMLLTKLLSLLERRLRKSDNR